MITVVIEDKPGLREWWNRGEDNKKFGNFFSKAEVELLPERLFKCVKTTESLADFVKKEGKRYHK